MYGRRFSMVLGSIIIIGSTFGQTWAVNFGMFCAFKFVIGICIGITQLSSTPRVTKLAHPKESLDHQLLQHIHIYWLYRWSMGYLFNFPSGFTVVMANSMPSSDYVLRPPIILHLLLSRVTTLASRSWTGGSSKSYASEVLIDHGDGEQSSPLVDWEFSEITQAIALEKSQKYFLKQLVTNRGLLCGSFICICCGVFSQTSGNGLVSSYLPSILASADITETKTVTLINGCNSIWSWLIAVICAFLTPRLRRRTIFLTGTTAMLTFFIAWTIAQARYDITRIQGAGYAVLVFIFLFNAAYSFCWIFLVVTYPLEIAPYKWRAKLWALVMLSISISAFFNQHVNPIGLENSGWKYYVYYDVWILIEILIIYFFFPETSGRSLEEVAVVFDGEHAAITGDVKIDPEIIQHEEVVREKNAV